MRPDRWEFDLAARLELRAGQQDGSTPGTALVDMEIDPVLAVRGPLRTGSLTLAYEPRIFITVNQVPGQSSNTVSYLHRGHFILDLKPTPLWRWFIETRTAYGEYDFSPLSTVIPQTGGTLLPPAQPTTPTAPPVAPVPGPGVSTLPDQRYIQVVDIDGSTGVVAALSPRVSWLLSVGYTYSGGANAAAQTQIPLQKGPKGATGAILVGHPQRQHRHPADRLPEHVQQRARVCHRHPHPELESRLEPDHCHRPDWRGGGVPLLRPCPGDDPRPDREQGPPRGRGRTP